MFLITILPLLTIAKSNTYGTLNRMLSEHLTEFVPERITQPSDKTLNTTRG